MPMRASSAAWRPIAFAKPRRSGKSRDCWQQFPAVQFLVHLTGQDLQLMSGCYRKVIPSGPAFPDIEARARLGPSARALDPLSFRFPRNQRTESSLRRFHEFSLRRIRHLPEPTIDWRNTIFPGTPVSCRPHLPRPLLDLKFCALSSSTNAMAAPSA